MTEHTGFHNKEHYSPDCYECRGDKMAELKRQIDIRRDNAFSQSLFGSREHQAAMQAKVDTYDTVLKLLKELGEIDNNEKV